MHRDPDGRMLIGPGFDPAASPLDDQPAELIESARHRLRESERKPREDIQIMRRLIVAFLLVAVIAVLSFVILPQYGLHLPPMVPLLAFVVIVVGSLMSADHPPPRNRRDCEDEGRPICCSGPRPLRAPPEHEP
ncbi:MAG: hypothetical protein D6695_05360 [Planctomycetota bacterium]|nr:MAG: hypothetical protein D6695_05360 [Planctomycetota bacterium]